MIKGELGTNGELTLEDIAYLIKNNDNTKYLDNERYYKGDDPPIIDQDDKANENVPDNRIVVSYGRKVTKTTKNYMFSQPVLYVAEDKEYIKTLNDIFYINDNNKRVSDVGLDIILHGVAYKLFYMAPDRVGTDIPLYSVIEGNEMICVYNYDIEPKLIAAIRYYPKGTGEELRIYIDVYYESKAVNYQTTTSSTEISETTIKRIGENPHVFGGVPVVCYGDKYGMGVFDAAKTLIDGVDKLASMNLNEIEKFELAYLVLKGQKITKEDLDDIVEKRLFQLDDNADLQYLLKTIDGEFNGNVLEFFVSEIHKQTGVPDFASKDFAAESGVALLYKLMGFENLASDIEAVFKEGEQKSIDLINSVAYRNKTNTSEWDKISFWHDNQDKQVTIIMSRNLPEDVRNKMEIAKMMKEIGFSQESIFDYSPMVDDTEKEIERATGEQQADLERFVEVESRKVDEPQEEVIEEEELDGE